MPITRRDTLKYSAAGIVGFGAVSAIPFAAFAQGESGTYETDGGEIAIWPVQHASFVMKTPKMVIYNDPVGGGDLYADHPKPDLILITHRHEDHFKPDTLQALVGSDTRILTNSDVHGLLPDDLKAKAEALATGESTTIDGMKIEAIAAYNTTEDRLKYHPKERGDNGYVLSIDGRRVYIAGDTEDTPEMRALKDIDIAFLPMNLPFTMTEEQAASAVAAFKPKIVYPYHYKGLDPKKFASLVKEEGADTKVVLGAWYG